MEETSRMAKLSSNVWKLSKLDSQNVLPEKNEFDLTEQVRKCILILEQEWSKKR